MKVLACGSRHWEDERFLSVVLAGLYATDSVGWLTVTAMPFTVISGMARGADKHAANWVNYDPLHGEVVDLKTYDYVTYDDKQNGMPVALMPFPGDWMTHDRAGVTPVPCRCPVNGDHCKLAGFRRNQEMLDAGQPELVVAFADDLSKSPGTSDMIRRSKRAMVPVLHIRHA